MASRVLLIQAVSIGMLLVVTMNMMRMYSDSTSVDPPLFTEPVLVLGSGGLVGRALVLALRHAGYPVHEVKSRADLDLRRPETFTDHLDLHNYSFCFFLACEVGGSRYLNDERNTRVMTQHNEMIYDQVFPFLQRNRLPFIFMSSQLASTDTPYGHVKRRGEELTMKANGKSVRFWNVYGPEPLGTRSHVVTDWIHACITTGNLTSLTHGNETRIFTYTDDVARGLVLLMEHFADMEAVVDLTRHETTTLRDLAQRVTRDTCTFHRPMASVPLARFASSAVPRVSLSLADWHPRVSLDDGLGMVRAHLEAVVQGYEHACRTRPYVSFVFAMRDDDYGHGMWTRATRAMHTLIQAARAVYLPFEIVVGEYNQRPADGKLAKRTDWPTGALYRIRTIPQAVHVERTGFGKQTNHSFWEYLGKNAAARVAKGEYLLLFNPDNLLPFELVALLARRGLRENNVYRTARYDREPEPVSHVLNIHNPKEKPMGMFDFASGDFTLVSRARFIEVGGYPEIPWNTHVDSLGLWRFLCVGYNKTTWYPHMSQVTLEHGVWHQNHQRNTDWSTPRDAMFAEWPCDRRQTVWGYPQDDARITETVLDQL